MKTIKSDCHLYPFGWTPEEHSPLHKRRIEDVRKRVKRAEAAPSRSGIATKPNFITGYPV
jgi:hypothetical protein